MIQCVKCGHVNIDKAKRCEECGARLRTPRRYLITALVFSVLSFLAFLITLFFYNAFVETINGSPLAIIFVIIFLIPLVFLPAILGIVFMIIALSTMSKGLVEVKKSDDASKRLK